MSILGENKSEPWKT